MRFSLSLSALIVTVIVLVGLGLYILVSTSNPNATSQVHGSSSSSVPQVEMSQLQLNTSECSGQAGCESSALITGILSVNANSPLSCIELAVNGTSNGSSCFNLSATAFTKQVCSGPGANSSCSLIISQNTYTLNTRTMNYSEVIEGSVINVMPGKTYILVFVLDFEDGGSAMITRSVVAG